MKKITRIAPRSLGRVMGLAYGMLGLIGGTIVFIVSLIGALLGRGSGGGVLFGIGGLILIPLFYALIGFVIAYIISWIYNFAAKKVGGIEIEIETSASHETKPSETA